MKLWETGVPCCWQRPRPWVCGKWAKPFLIWARTMRVGKVFPGGLSEYGQRLIPVAFGYFETTLTEPSRDAWGSGLLVVVGALHQHEHTPNWSQLFCPCVCVFVLSSFPYHSYSCFQDPRHMGHGKWLLHFIYWTARMGLILEFFRNLK